MTAALLWLELAIAVVLVALVVIVRRARQSSKPTFHAPERIARSGAIKPR